MTKAAFYSGTLCKLPIYNDFVSVVSKYDRMASRLGMAQRKDGNGCDDFKKEQDDRYGGFDLELASSKFPARKLPVVLPLGPQHGSSAANDFRAGTHWCVATISTAA